jgi:hypothetical protein
MYYLFLHDALSPPTIPRRFHWSFELAIFFPYSHCRIPKCKEVAVPVVEAKQFVIFVLNIISPTPHWADVYVIQDNLIGRTKLDCTTQMEIS